MVDKLLKPKSSNAPRKGGSTLLRRAVLNTQSRK